MNLEREGTTYPTGRWFGGPGMQLRGRQRPLLGPCGKAGSVFMGAPSSKERHAKVLVGKCQVCSEALFRMLVCKGPSYLPHTYDSYTIIQSPPSYVCYSQAAPNSQPGCFPILLPSIRLPLRVLWGVPFPHLLSTGVHGLGCL